MRNKKEASVKLYFMMNKAGGTVCSTVSDRRKTVYEVFPEEQLISPEGAKLHTVGRLDADTEGLLFLTNDGKFSNYLTRPENNIKKTYLVKLLAPVDDGQKEQYKKSAAEGLILPPEKKAEEQKSNGAFIEWKNDLECLITLTEGKFHEVKRIFRALNNEVIFLKRISMGGVLLDQNIPAGNYRALTAEELNILSSFSTVRK